MRVGAARFLHSTGVVLLFAAGPVFPVPSADAVTREVCVAGCSSATIQGAIKAAAAGDVILVHDGTYLENLDFRGKAVTVRSVNGPAVTVIDGSGIAPVAQFVSGEGRRTVLQGFTLTRGYGGFWAGGVRCDGSSPRIVGCVITGNKGNMGGGVRVFGGAPSFTNCEIIGNAGSYGGGVSASETAATFTSCRIAGNTSTFGAGIACFGLSTRTAPAPPEESPRFVNCVVSGNSTLVPSGCIQYLGGGLASSISSPTLVNCTFSGNYADKGSSIGAYRSAVKVVNCIFWNEGGDTFYVDTTATLSVTYSDVQYGRHGRGNRALDPQFVRPVYYWDAPTAEGDLRLRRTSPCIDTGTAAGAPRTDIEGQSRPYGPRVDMGADEHFGGVDVCHEGCVWGSVQAALDLSRKDDVIVVGDGVYAERLRFVGRGVTVRSLNGPAAAIIDGGSGGSTVTFSTETMDWQDRLSGFTVTGGSGTPDGGSTWGGGVLVESGASAVLERCRIAGNVADRGAGVAAVSGSYLRIEAAMVTGNRAAIEGGGLWMAGGELKEVTVAGNAAGVDAGGLFAAETTHPVFARNSIFWSNSAAGVPCEIAAPTGDMLFESCDIQGGSDPAVFDADPLFVAPAMAEAAPTTDGDYHIQAGSPCIDSGQAYPWLDFPQSDIDRDPKGDFEGRDVGADEYVVPGNLMHNASFEEGRPWPSGWVGNLLGSTDRVYLSEPYDGWASFLMTGARTAKTLGQSLAVVGAAGDSFTLRGRMRAPYDLATHGGFAGVRVRFFHRDGTVRTVRLAAPPTGSWTLAETTITAARSYRRIEVALCNSSNGGEVAFDAIRLDRN